MTWHRDQYKSQYLLYSIIEENEKLVKCCIVIKKVKLISRILFRFLLPATKFEWRMQVTWIRIRDWHILTSGLQTYTADARFRVKLASEVAEWTLEIKYLQKRDDGTYYCQVCAHLTHLLKMGRLGLEANVSCCFLSYEFCTTNEIIINVTNQE